MLTYPDRREIAPRLNMTDEPDQKPYERSSNERFRDECRNKHMVHVAGSRPVRE